MAEPKMLKKGKWQIRFRYKDPITNTWKDTRITGSTKKAVQEKYIEFMSNVAKGEINKDIKLLDFFDVWVDTYKKGKVTEGRMQKIQLTRQNLFDFFGTEQTLKGISKLTYQKFINWLGTAEAVKRGKTRLSEETISNRHNIIKSMFIEAVDMQYISSNPTRNVKLTGIKKPQRKSNLTIQRDDLEKFRHALLNRNDSVSKFFVLTQIYTGCRYQEVAALQWPDIDFEKEVIHVTKAFKYDARQKYFGPTKSESGVRDIDVYPELLTELKRYSLFQKQQILSGRLINPHKLLFCNDKDTWPVSNSMINKYIKETCEAAGVDRISSHSLRHARIDMMILADADPIYIKSQIGHKEISQSWGYASATEDNRKKNKNKVVNFMKAAD